MAPAVNTILGSGRTAFQFQPVGSAAAFVTQQVMRCQSSSGLAEAWTISLNAWQGNIVAMGNPGVTRARVTLLGGGEAGGGSATEIVLVDMPRSGVVFNVHAATVSVEVTTRMPGSLPAGGMPTFSGWLGRGRSAGARSMSATLTEGLRVVADGAGFSENVPPRARAFRVLWLTATAQVACLQLDAAFLGTANDTLVMTGASEHFLESSRSAWIPLHPDTVSLVLNNQDGAAGVGQWSVQWLLELG